MNQENQDVDIQTTIFGTLATATDWMRSGPVTDPNKVVLCLEEVEETKHSFKVSVKNFINDDKTVLHESLSFVDIFKEFKEKLATVSFMGINKSASELFKELVKQKLSEGNEYRIVSINNFYLVENNFIDWVVKRFPKSLKYINPTEGNDYLRFEYEKEFDNWRVYANKDFETTDGRTIAKNTKGGLVGNPTTILGKSWIEDGSFLEGNCLVKDSTITDYSDVDCSVLVNSKVARKSSVVKSILTNSKLFASEVLNSNFWEVEARQSYYSYIHALNVSDVFELLRGPERRGRLLSAYARGVAFRPFSARRIGSEEGLVTVGNNVEGNITIVRGCFEGSLEEFKARLDKDLGRSKLETEPYYGFVKYLHDKVAAKRYEALTPLVEKSQALFKPLEEIKLLRSENIKSLYYVLCTGSEEAAKPLSEAEENTHQLFAYYEENFDE